MRISYPTSVKIIKVPCTGRVDVIHILKAFEGGIDGVYLVGCLEGDCHYIAGNIRARQRVRYLKTILDEVGISSERVSMYNVSSAEGLRFAEIAREFTEKIKAMGPNPIRSLKIHGDNKPDSIKG